MQLARAATIAAIVLAPAFANATTYRLNAVVDYGPSQDFGTFSVSDSVVASGELRLGRSCPQFSPCNQAGPWDQVAFNFTNPLENGVLSTGPGAINNFVLTFDASGNVSGGSINVQAPEGQGVAFLSASLGGEPGPCTAGTLCGTYIPVPFAGAVPISLTISQQSNQLARPVPEPHIGWPLLVVGLLGLPWLAGVRH